MKPIRVDWPWYQNQPVRTAWPGQQLFRSQCHRSHCCGDAALPFQPKLSETEYPHNPDYFRSSPVNVLNILQFKLYRSGVKMHSLQESFKMRPQMYFL